jgi:hypothetical protein
MQPKTQNIGSRNITTISQTQVIGVITPTLKGASTLNAAGDMSKSNGPEQPGQVSVMLTLTVLPISASRAGEKSPISLERGGGWIIAVLTCHGDRLVADGGAV